MKVVKVLVGEMKRAEIQKALLLKHDDNFRIQYKRQIPGFRCFRNQKFTDVNDWILEQE